MNKLDQSHYQLFNRKPSILNLDAKVTNLRNSSGKLQLAVCTYQRILLVYSIAIIKIKSWILEHDINSNNCGILSKLRQLTIHNMKHNTHFSAPSSKKPGKILNNQTTMEEALEKQNTKNIYIFLTVVNAIPYYMKYVTSKTK